MQVQRHRPLLMLTFVLLSATASPAALAQEQACDSCESCTRSLAGAGARVTLAKDITQTGEGACVVVGGAGAHFDGLEHTVMVKPEGTAIRVTGADVLVKNTHVEGGAVGVELASSQRTTLFHAWIGGTVVGVSVKGAEEARITRSVISASGVGISFGADAQGRCADGATNQSEGAVVTDTRVQGASVGIAACEAYPVLARDQVVGNEVGIVLGAPGPGSGEGPKASGPYDSCACAPSLPGVSPGTTLLFSSGCGGCKVHEAWVPELTKQRHDILVRATGPGKVEEIAKFDAYMDRCAPEVTDALGIPGCVPNYTCVANGVTLKTRRGDANLTFETQISSSEEAAAYAKACQEAASRRFRAGPDCVAHALAGNVVCGNREMDIRAVAGKKRLDGLDDQCDKAEGFADTGKPGCAKPCTAVAPLPEAPPARAARPASPPSGVAASASAATAAPPSAEARGNAASTDGASNDRSRGWLVGLGGVVLAGAALAWMLRGGRKGAGQ